MLDDEALVDSLMRSAFFALYGLRPPLEIPLREVPGSVAIAAGLH